MKAALLVVPLLIAVIWVARERASRAAEQSLRETANESTFEKDPHADCAAEREELLARIAKLEARLGSAQADALLREESWLEYNRMIVSIAPEDLFPELHAAKVQAALADQPPDAPDPVFLAQQERSREIQVSLNALFRAEGIDAFDLLEVGLVESGAIGPVLLRSFDERGRAIGTITADRLRLEGSRAGRTLTLVLEDGYTRRSGERVPFAGADDGAERGGVLRVVIPDTDPDGWSRAVPELFSEDHTLEILDDGRWNRFMLRRDLNARLDRGGLGGRYVLKDLAGVRDGVLRDVALDELDENGSLRRRLFADRLILRVDRAGVQLVLEDGVVVRGEQKLPFLDGRMRVYLPRADVGEWVDGSLPVIDARDVELDTDDPGSVADEADSPADGTEASAQETESSPVDAEPTDAADEAHESAPESTDSALPR